MTLETILNDKEIKGKEKVEAIGNLLLENKISIAELISTASNSKDPNKANCIEAIEFATRKNPLIADAHCLHFVTEMLLEKAPRIKWESAKVIGNIASKFPNNLEQPIHNLLINTESSGTVVRWSAAFALGEIIKLNTKHNALLLDTINSIVLREEKNSIKKIYLSAIKALNKK